MPVNLETPNLENIFDIPGVVLKHTMAGIRKIDRKDLLLIELAENTSVAGVFTKNLFCAAPVQVAKEHLSNANLLGIRALIINTGNANAATGETGLAHAKLTCQALAEALNIKATQVLPFSTGVILEPLPIDRLLTGITKVTQNTEKSTWLDAAQAIMTTDTLPKLHSLSYQNSHGETIYITGISKGAGMIRPNMATMLGFICTNANIAQADLQDLIQEVANQSFNNITIDGDTSTNDSFIIAATNQSSLLNINNINNDNINDSDSNSDYALFKNKLIEIAKILAQKIVRDGEGATKFITIEIENAPSQTIARQVAYSIAHSPLVKTAFYASDPNLGRILAAIGYSGAAIDVQKIQMWINDAYVVKDGARHVSYLEEDGQAAMKNAEITIKIDLNQGAERLQIWTCDFSHEYVSINADYRS